MTAWNVLISGYTENGHGQKALECFEKMKHQGVSPNAITFVSTLRACASIRDCDKGEEIHAKIERKDLISRNPYIRSSLVAMYAKCGFLVKARKVFDHLLVRNIVTWNALISGYAQQDQYQEALHSFERMQSEGILPDVVPYICVLKACGKIGAMDKGQRIHEQIISRSLLGKDAILGNALLDMYIKCGMLGKAQELLEKLPVRDEVTWSSLILGYAEQEQGHEALNCFEKMQNEGLIPNVVTLSCVLSACSRSGKLNEAQMLFTNMTTKYGINPTLEHYTCMVMAFGCAGRIEKAISLIKTMPHSDESSVWIALLGACTKWGNVKFGRVIFDQALQIDNTFSGAYVLMANIFASANMQGDR